MNKTRKIKKGHYQHFKGGHYELLDVVTNSENLESMVLYQSVEDGKKWVRPLEMFFESVEHEDKKIPRFKYVGEK